MKKNILLPLIIAASVATTFTVAQAHEGEKHDKKEASEKSGDTKKGKPYPLENCVVSDEKLGEHGKPYAFVHDGQQVKLCCKDCLKDFKKEPAKYMKKIEDAPKEKK